MLELSEMRSPERENEEKVNLLADALTVMYNFGAINKTEPILLNEVEILSGGQDTPLDLKIPLSCTIINRIIIEPNKIDIIIQNLRKQNINKDSYVIALRWMRKAAIEKDIVDRFIAYWIAFNALYGKLCKGEQACIKRFVQDEFNDSECKDLLENGISDMTIATVYSSGLKLRSCDVTGDLETAYELIKQNRSSDFNKCVELLVLSIYAVRNNIFHGQFLHGQYHELINGSTQILIRLLRDYLTKALYIV